MKYKTFFLGVLLFFSTVLLPSYAFASEGTVELRSTDGNDYRCYASSLLMTNRQYRVSVSCRDLLYSTDNALIYYVLWSTPVPGSKNANKPIRLIDLGLGRVGFDTPTAFTQLYVTAESTRDPQSPSSRVVMSGQVQPIRFLENPASPLNITSTIMPTGINSNAATTSPAPSSTREKITVALQRAAIIAVGVVVIGGAIIFAITRAKG